MTLLVVETPQVQPCKFRQSTRTETALIAGQKLQHCRRVSAFVRPLGQIQVRSIRLSQGYLRLSNRCLALHQGDGRSAEKEHDCGPGNDATDRSDPQSPERLLDSVNDFFGGGAELERLLRFRQPSNTLKVVERCGLCFTRLQKRPNVNWQNSALTLLQELFDFLGNVYGSENIRLGNDDEQPASSQRALKCGL